MYINVALILYIYLYISEVFILTKPEVTNRIRSKDIIRDQIPRWPDLFVRMIGLTRSEDG